MMSGLEVLETDILVTVGKDKFVVFLPDADASAGNAVRERLESLLKHYDFKRKEWKIIPMAAPMERGKTVKVPFPDSSLLIEYSKFTTVD